MTTAAIPILTAAEMRDAERDAVAGGISLAELMERAGAAIAEAAWRYGCGREVLILCGPGNNGGDGYVAACVLKARGASVRVAASGEPGTDLASAARARWNGPVEALETARTAPVIVDALFGTGLSRALDRQVAAALARLCGAAGLSLAADLPSGVGSDDGTALGASAVTMTLALGAMKPAHCLQPAAALCGTVRVADIGIEAASSLNLLARPVLREPGPDMHKYKRGHVAIAGGAMGGAAMLAARAAMRVAGYVAVTGARRQGPDALVHRRWDDVAADERVGALLIGPGLGRDERARAMLDAAMATRHPLVLDADALMLAGVETLAGLDRPVILTPHEGEFAALFGAMAGSKVERARQAARQARAVIILKGADTVIAEPGGQAWIAPPAPGWLASAGTGDVLAGLAAALLASGMTAADAAKAAVWLHGEAARRAGPALIADELIAHLPGAVAACL